MPPRLITLPEALALAAVAALAAVPAAAWLARVKRAPALGPGLVAAAAAALYFLFFAGVTLGRHYSLATRGLDLGYYANAVWQFGHGHPFAESFLPPQRFVNHCAPLLAAFAPASWVFGDPAYLLVLQAGFLAAAVVLVYAVGRPENGTRWPAAALAFGFALSPALHAANLYDFHPRALGVPLALAAFYLFSRRRFVPGLIFTAFFALAEDELALHAVALAAWGGFAAGRRRAGLVAALALAAYFVGVCCVLYPRLTYAPAGQPLHYAGYFLREAPAAVTPRNLMIISARAGYIGALVFPALCFLPAGGGALITLATPLAVPALARTPNVFTLGWQYPLGVLPFVYGVAALGVRRLVRAGMGPRRRFLLAFGSVAAVLFPLLLVGVLARGHYAPALAPLWRGPHELALLRATRLVPPAVPVAADDNLTPHLAHRRCVYDFNAPLPAGLSAAPRALLLDRRRHTPQDFAAVWREAQRFRLGLAAFTGDYAYFAPGPGRYGAGELFRRWFGSIEEWQCPRPSGGRAERDGAAGDGRALLVPRRLRYEPQPGYVMPAGAYTLTFRLRPADPTAFCFAVVDVKADTGGGFARGPRYRLAAEVPAGGDYSALPVAFASERPFKLGFEIWAVSPFLFDGAAITSADYNRYYLETLK